MRPRSLGTTFTGPIPGGPSVKRAHLTDLRDRINEVRAFLSMPSITFAALPANSATIRQPAVELRSALQ